MSSEVNWISRWKSFNAKTILPKALNTIWVWYKTGTRDKTCGTSIPTNTQNISAVPVESAELNTHDNVKKVQITLRVLQYSQYLNWNSLRYELWSKHYFYKSQRMMIESSQVKTTKISNWEIWITWVFSLRRQDGRPGNSYLDPEDSCNTGPTSGLLSMF